MVRAKTLFFFTRWIESIFSQLNTGSRINAVFKVLAFCELDLSFIPSKKDNVPHYRTLYSRTLNFSCLARFSKTNPHYKLNRTVMFLSCFVGIWFIIIISHFWSDRFSWSSCPFHWCNFTRCINGMRKSINEWWYRKLARSKSNGETIFGLENRDSSFSESNLVLGK